MNRFFAVILVCALLLAGCDRGGDTPKEGLEEPAEASRTEESPAESTAESSIAENSSAESSEEELDQPTVTAEEAKALLTPDESGVVEISSAEHLMALSALVASGDTGHAALTYVQKGRINLAGIAFIPIGNGTPLDTGATPAEEPPAACPFLGTYDGGGNIVSGLTVRSPDNDYGVGLFGYVGPGAVVRNIHLIGGSVTGTAMVGGVAGAVEGTLYNCSFNGTVAACGERAGGIAGQLVAGKTEAHAGKIECCFSNAEVSAPAWLGGFVGVAAPGTVITNSYGLGKITVSDSLAEKHWIAGGFIGEANGEVTRCFSNAEVYAELPAERMGGFAGYISGTVTGCYFNKPATENWKDIGYIGDGPEPGVTACTVAELVEQATYANWDFTNTWEIDGEHNRGLPFLRPAELY